ncbi:MULTISPECIES: hypothetical protein [unclassified Pseudonocardia]|uniref:hypothetical protein n=1 Tax=Pseudonocardia TaxID=1847 RepID=UPI00192C0ACA|nr:hypothetical protein [Pseudonocardia sp. Ae707_Ps1]
MHTEAMRVELLVIRDCPNEETAASRLRDGLDATGHEATPVEVRTMTEESIAGTPEFAGSPTILIDGIDPFAEQTAGPAGNSCRIYRSEAGVSGAPSLEQLRQVLSS